MEIGFYKIIFLLTIVEALIMAVTIVVIKKRPRFAFYYSLLNFFIAGWSLGKLLSLYAETSELALLWLRISIMFSILIFFCFYKSILVFTNNGNHSLLDKLIFLSCFSMLVLNSIDILFGTSYILSVPVKRGIFPYYEIGGNYYYLYLLLVVAIFLITMGCIKKGFFRILGLVKLQLKYVLVAVFMALAAVASTFLYTLGINIEPFLLILLPFHFLIIFYAALNQRLLGGKYFVSSFFVDIFFATVVFVALHIIYQMNVFIGDMFSERALFINILVSFIFAVVFLRLMDYIRNRAYRFFTKGKNPHEAKKDILFNMSKIAKLEDLQFVLNKHLAEYIDIGSLHIVIPTDVKKELPYVLFLDYKAFDLEGVEYYSFSDVLRLENQTLLRSEILSISGSYMRNLKILDDACGQVEVILPLVSGDKLIAFAVFNAKVGGDSFTKDDLDFLDDIKNEIADIVFGLVEIWKKEERLCELGVLEKNFYKVIKKMLYIPGQELAKKLDYCIADAANPGNDNFQIAIEKAEVIGELAHDFLLVSEIESRQFNFGLVPTNINNLIQEIYMQKKAKVEHEKLSFELHLPDEKIHILSNRPFISQAIIGVINNSIYYTKTGGIDIRLELSNDGKKAMIKVSDTGIGIPSENKSMIFNKFFRMKDAFNSYADGSGLGLFNAMMIMERHEGGRIYVEKSEVGQGTTIVIEVNVTKNLDF